MRDGRGSCLDSRRLGSITCRPGSGTVSPSPSSGHGLITGVCTGNYREAGECPNRHLRATTSHVRSTQVAGVVFPGEQVPHAAAGHFDQRRRPRCLPPAMTPVGEILFATGQIVFGGTPVLAVAAVGCLLPVVVAASAGAAVRAGRWRWPPASHGGGTTEPRCGPHRSHLRRVRAAQPRPWPRPAIERAPEVHLHLHGLSAEDIAVILVRRDE